MIKDSKVLQLQTKFAYLIFLSLSFSMFAIADTVHPTAYISASTSFASSLNVTAYISFSEPCNGGGGGFRCLSVNACNVSRCSAYILLSITTCR